MPTEVPMTSQGILDFASELHATASAMDAEVDASQATKVASQSFLGTWTDFLNTDPFTEPPPRGLLALVAKIRSPMHVINATADFQRLNRTNKRLQALWDDGSKGDTSKGLSGHTWTTPRPDDRVPGKSVSPAGIALDLGGDVGKWLLVGGLVYLLLTSGRK